jgi:hypothetical protein
MGPPGAHEYVRKTSERIKEGDYSRKTWHNQLLWVERPATELDSVGIHTEEWNDPA